MNVKALGSAGVAALGIASLAPALGIYANLGPMFSSSGSATPAVFIVALLFTLPTALSYSLMSGEVPSAGSAYTWLTQAINQHTGAWTGIILLISYAIAVILQPILFGVFFNAFLASVFSIQVGYATWALGVLLSSAIVAALVYPGITVSAKSSIVLTAFEFICVVSLACTIIWRAPHNGTVFREPLGLAHALANPSGLAKGLVFGLLSFVGFQVITTVAEETRSPRSSIPRIMLLSCFAVGTFWTFCAWAFALGLPPDKWAPMIARDQDPIAVIAQRYWGRGSIFVLLTSLSAVLGVYLACVVGYARTAWSMGESGDLPALFGRLHPRYRSPWNAQHVIFVVTLALALFWGYKFGLNASYDWWGTSLVIFSMIPNMFVNIGCTVFFYRFRRDHFHWLWHGLSPLLGVITSFLPLYYSCGPDLWNAGWMKGQSIIVFSGLLVILTTAYVARRHSA